MEQSGGPPSNALISTSVVVRCLLAAECATSACSWPGNPLYDQNEQMTRCWNVTDGGEETIIVHISDMCPCLQREDSARPERVTGVNTPCCGDIYHVRKTCAPHSCAAYSFGWCSSNK